MASVEVVSAEAAVMALSAAEAVPVVASVAEEVIINIPN